jgi:hypothetical protein
LRKRTPQSSVNSQAVGKLVSCLKSLTLSENPLATESWVMASKAAFIRHAAFLLKISASSTACRRCHQSLADDLSKSIYGTHHGHSQLNFLVVFQTLVILPCSKKTHVRALQSCAFQKWRSTMLRPEGMCRLQRSMKDCRCARLFLATLSWPDKVLAHASRECHGKRPHTSQAYGCHALPSGSGEAGCEGIQKLPCQVFFFVSFYTENSFALQ